MTAIDAAKNSDVNILLYGPSCQEKIASAVSLAEPSHALYCADSEDEAHKIFKSHPPQLVIINFDEKNIRIFDFIEWLKNQVVEVQAIGVTEKNSLHIAVRAVKAGLFSVVDIASDQFQLEKDISTAIKQWRQKQQGQELLDSRKSNYDFSKIVGASPKMKKIFNLVSRIVQRKWATVLIRGETGTGKELIARSIHYNTCTSNEPFIEINCSALTESLLESELFGHEKGAFTDAKTSKIGLFELAQNGTLFLDEIGDISIKVQINLLKALEEKTIRRVGGTRDIKIKARIITATNRDLQAAIKKGEFRNDLYYRLNVLTIDVPPLRERSDDVILLANHFLKIFASEYECPLEGFSPDAEQLLLRYQWPGNVRELRHAIERITLLSDNTKVTYEELEQTLESETPIILSEFEDAKKLNIEIPPHGVTLEEVEKAVILEILTRYGWNKRRTCRTLNISRPRLDRKIRLYNLSPQEK